MKEAACEVNGKARVAGAGVGVCRDGAERVETPAGLMCMRTIAPVERAIIYDALNFVAQPQQAFALYG